MLPMIRRCPGRDGGWVGVQVVAAVMVVGVVVAGLFATEVPERVACGVGGAVSRVAGGGAPGCVPVSAGPVGAPTEVDDPPMEEPPVGGPVVEGPVGEPSTVDLLAGDSTEDPAEREGAGREGAGGEGSTLTGTTLTGTTFSAGGEALSTGPAGVPGVAELIGRVEGTGRCLGALGGADGPSLICFTSADVAAGGVETLERCGDSGASGSGGGGFGSLVCGSTTSDVRPVLDTSPGMNVVAWCQPVVVGAPVEGVPDIGVTWACGSWARDVYFCDGTVAVDAGYDWAGDRVWWPRRCDSRTLSDRSLGACTDLVSDGVTQCTLQDIDDRPRRVISCLEFVGPGELAGSSHVIDKPLHCVAEAGLSTVATGDRSTDPEGTEDQDETAAAAAAGAGAVGAIAGGAAAVIGETGESAAAAAGAGGASEGAAAEGAAAEAAEESVAGEGIDEAEDPDDLLDTDHTDDEDTDSTDGESDDDGAEDEQEKQEEPSEREQEEDPLEGREIVSAGFWRCPANWITGVGGACTFVADEDRTPVDRVGPDRCGVGEVWHADQGVCSPPSTFQQCTHPEGVVATTTGGSCRIRDWPAGLSADGSPCAAGYDRSGTVTADGTGKVTCRQRSGTAVECVPRTGVSAVIAATIGAQNPFGYFVNPDNVTEVCSIPGADEPQDRVYIPAPPAGVTALSCPVVPALQGRRLEEQRRGSSSPQTPADPLAASAVKVDWRSITPSPHWRTDANPLWRGDSRPPLTAEDGGAGIFTTGFHPRGTRTSLGAHAFGQDSSAFVPTSRNRAVAGRFAAGLGLDGGFIYQIQAPHGVDVSATLAADAGGSGASDHVYFDDEEEVAFPGGIAARFVRSAIAAPSFDLGPPVAVSETPNPCFGP